MDGDDKKLYRRTSRAGRRVAAKRERKQSRISEEEVLAWQNEEGPEQFRQELALAGLCCDSPAVAVSFCIEDQSPAEAAAMTSSLSLCEEGRSPAPRRSRRRAGQRVRDRRLQAAAAAAGRLGKSLAVHPADAFGQNAWEKTEGGFDLVAELPVQPPGLEAFRPAALGPALEERQSLEQLHLRQSPVSTGTGVRANSMRCKRSYYPAKTSMNAAGDAGHWSSEEASSSLHIHARAKSLGQLQHLHTPLFPSRCRSSSPPARAEHLTEPPMPLAPPGMRWCRRHLRRQRDSADSKESTEAAMDDSNEAPRRMSSARRWLDTGSLLPSYMDLQGDMRKTWVLIDGLVKSPEFNGQRGFVEAYDEEMQRYVVRIFVSDGCGGHTTTLAKLRRENILLPVTTEAAFDLVPDSST
eukprot:TRINITY_DN63056_c0_g1_i1.p1 TRINITY_DN63056_c0_g1~~TRINITY_DN63056_c0_g1_i1.p1  ORF type:complete len:410 (-),score=61.64 TRINITY_DN63056_c0_g1_i1:227-1456(-)